MLPEKKTRITDVAGKEVWLYSHPAIVRKRAKRLKISSKELRELSLVGLKGLAKRNFGEMIKHYHPDTRFNYKDKFGESVAFGKLIRGYHFISALTEKDLEKCQETEKDKWDYERYFPLPWHYYHLPKIGYDQDHNWRG